MSKKGAVAVRNSCLATTYPAHLKPGVMSFLLPDDFDLSDPPALGRSDPVVLGRSYPGWDRDLNQKEEQSSASSTPKA